MIKNAARAFLIMTFLSQSIGAADIAVIAARPMMSPPPKSLILALAQKPRFMKSVRSVYDDQLRAYADVGSPASAYRAPRRGKGMTAFLGRTMAALYWLGKLFSTPDPYLPRMEGRWVSAGKIRYRVNYLDSVGYSWSDGKGLHAYVPYLGRVSDPSAKVPSFQHEFGTYLAHQRARLEIEIENISATPFKGVRFWGRQESYDPKGGKGRMIEDPDAASTREAFIGDLAPGRRVKVERTFLLGSGEKDVNLEQTHLLVVGRSMDGAPLKLADDPQAGIVDPPRF